MRLEAEGGGRISISANDGAKKMVLMGEIGEGYRSIRYPRFDKSLTVDEDFETLTSHDKRLGERRRRKKVISEWSRMVFFVVLRKARLQDCAPPTEDASTISMSVLYPSFMACCCIAWLSSVVRLLGGTFSSTNSFISRVFIISKRRSPLNKSASGRSGYLLRSLRIDWDTGMEKTPCRNRL